MSDLELTVTKIIPAPPKDVFEAWLNPDALAQFMKPAADMASARVTVDATEGGAFEIIMRAGEKEIPHRGEYKVIRPHERIVFTWLSDWTLPDSTVTLDFADPGDGTTELTLHHVGFPDAESRDSHEGGWAEILEMSIPVVS